MKLGTSLALLAGGLALVANACDYPEFSFREGAGAVTSTGGNAGQGGALGGSGGSGATGGAAPECTPIGSPGGCLEGNKCTVVDPTLGTPGCVPAGSTPDFQACAANAECGAYSWCDDPTGVCRPVCPDATTCTNVFGLGAGTTCAATEQGGQAVMGGLKVCTAHCNPNDSTPCRSVDTAVTCSWRSTPGDWDCMVSGGVGHGDGCTNGWDCSPQLACAPNGTCQPWCDAPGCCCTQCIVVCGGCEAFGVAPVYNGQSLGACYDVVEHPHGCLC
jgi:hypothetical protein